MTTDEKFENINKEVGSLKEDIKEILDFLKPDNSEKEINPDTKLILNALEANAQESKLNKDAILGNYVSQSNKIRDEIRASQRVPTESVEKDVEPNPKFIRRMWLSQAIALVVSCVLSVFTFNNLIPAFPFALGLMVTFIGTTVWLFLDEFMFEDYSIGRIGKNAVSLGLTTIAISILYFTGITIGNSYISNPLGSENEKPQQVIERTDSDTGHSNSNAGAEQPSASRGQGTQLPISASEGTAQSEQ